MKALRSKVFVLFIVGALSAINGFGQYHTVRVTSKSSCNADVLVGCTDASAVIFNVATYTTEVADCEPAYPCYIKIDFNGGNAEIIEFNNLIGGDCSGPPEYYSNACWTSVGGWQDYSTEYRYGFTNL